MGLSPSADGTLNEIGSYVAEDRPIVRRKSRIWQARSERFRSHRPILRRRAFLQPHLETRPLAGLAPQVDVPAKALDDLFDDCQTQAGAAVLGGEERLEDARPGGFVHAGAGVLDRPADPEALVAFDAQGAHAECTALRHGVAGIEAKVHDDLLELCIV